MAGVLSGISAGCSPHAAAAGASAAGVHQRPGCLRISAGVLSASAAGCSPASAAGVPPASAPGCSPASAAGVPPVHQRPGALRHQRPGCSGIAAKCSPQRPPPGCSLEPGQKFCGGRAAVAARSCSCWTTAPEPFSNAGSSNSARPQARPSSREVRVRRGPNRGVSRGPRVRPGWVLPRAARPRGPTYQSPSGGRQSARGCRGRHVVLAR